MPNTHALSRGRPRQLATPNPAENGRSAPPERPDLDRAHLGHRVPGRDFDRFLEAAALEDVEAADDLLGLGERAVGDDRLPVADTDGASSARRSQLIAGHPDSPSLEIVEPRKALVVLRCLIRRFRLGLSVHLLRVPAHQHQELHRPLPSSFWYQPYL